MQFVITNDIEEVRSLVSEGFCPVECSIGGESIVDALVMDHHGKLSHLESVALRAYRDHFGARADDPRFVGVGVADADMTFAVAALAGLLPEDSVKVAELAEMVASADVEPIGLDLLSSEAGRALLFWNAVHGSGRDSVAAIAAVEGWRRICEPRNAGRLAPFIEAATLSEQSRKEAARADLAHSISEGRVLALNGTTSWGFDVWYSRCGGEFTSPEGWVYPIVLARYETSPGKYSITIGCPCTEVAETLLGPGGLKNVFSKLTPDGWGGREAIGGSPRGINMTSEDLRAALETIKGMI